MNRIFGVLLVLMVGLAMIGCAVGGASDGGGDVILWSDAGTTDSSIALSNDDLNFSVSGAMAQSVNPVSQAVGSSDDRVYFRSSDVEFWSISSINDLDAIQSRKYNPTNPGDVSLEYALGDLEESVVFRPYSRVAVQRGASLNADWTDQVQSYIDAGKTTLNLARLDIGGGEISFIVHGDLSAVSHSDGSGAYPYTREQIEEAYADGVINEETYLQALHELETYSGGIDANSIFFIDRQFLSKPILAERETQYAIADGMLSAADVGLETTEFAFIKRLFENSNSNQDEFTSPTMDVDGALCVPLDPVDISGFDPAVDNLKIVITWKMAGAVLGSSGGYRMADRVGGTCLDFAVELVIE